MPDLLTHALVGYVLATALSWRFERLTPPLVTVAMVGAVLPDLNRIGLVVPATAIDGTLGVPFSWAPLHQIAGTAVLVLAGGVLVPATYRCRVLLLLALGAGSHYLLDALLYKPSGRTTAFLWPATTYQFPAPGVYVSTDRWPALVAVALAVGAWAITRSRHSGDDGA